MWVVFLLLLSLLFSVSSAFAEPGFSWPGFLQKPLLRITILSPGATVLARPPQRIAVNTPASSSLASHHGGLRSPVPRDEPPEEVLACTLATTILIGSPLNQYRADNPLNSINAYDPKNPLNPINQYDPGNPANPINQYNPSNPYNPFNQYNPKNPLNPINEYNPFYAFPAAQPLAASLALAAASQNVSADVSCRSCSSVDGLVTIIHHHAYQGTR